MKHLRYVKQEQCISHYQAKDFFSRKSCDISVQTASFNYKKWMECDIFKVLCQDLWSVKFYIEILQKNKEYFLSITFLLWCILMWECSVNTLANICSKNLMLSRRAVFQTCTYHTTYFGNLELFCRIYNRESAWFTLVNVQYNRKKVENLQPPYCQKI